MTDLKANGYPEILLRKCLRSKEKIRKVREGPLGLAVLPYVRGVSDQVGRVVQKFRIRTAFKPVRTLGHIFRKPKDTPPADWIGGIVYIVKCNDCSFTYIGESKRSWTSRGAEHDPGRASNKESAIKQHSETTDRDIHPGTKWGLEGNRRDWIQIMPQKVGHWKRLVNLAATLGWGIGGHFCRIRTSGKASARGPRVEPSMIQAARATKNRQLNSTLKQRIVITPRDKVGIGGERHA